jgi:hypothetical protein
VSGHDAGSEPKCQDCACTSMRRPRFVRRNRSAPERCSGLLIGGSGSGCPSRPVVPGADLGEAQEVWDSGDGTWGADARSDVHVWRFRSSPALPPAAGLGVSAAQRLIHLTAGENTVQQHVALAGHGGLGAAHCDLRAALRALGPVPRQVGTGRVTPQDAVGGSERDTSVGTARAGPRPRIPAYFYRGGSTSSFQMPWAKWRSLLEARDRRRAMMHGSAILLDRDAPAVWA